MPHSLDIACPGGGTRRRRPRRRLSAIGRPRRRRLGGYTLDALVRDYRRGLLSAFQTLCSPGDMDLGESRGDTLMQGWIERSLARLRDVPADGFA